MEKLLKEILAKLNNLEEDMKDFKQSKVMIKEIYDLKPKIEESHRWLSTLVEYKEIQKAEMDSLKIDVAKVTGVLKGFDNSLELLKKAE